MVYTNRLIVTGTLLAKVTLDECEPLIHSKSQLNSSLYHSPYVVLIQFNTFHFHWIPKLPHASETPGRFDKLGLSLKFPIQ